MNILFLSRFDVKDINMWSGTVFYMYKALENMHRVESMGKEFVFQLNYFSRNNKGIQAPIIQCTQALCKLLSERIERSNYDVIFFGDIFFTPFLCVDIPIVIISDTTYEQISNFQDITDEKEDTNIIELEKLFLERCTHAIYSSEWAKQNVIDFYTINPDKIDVVEFGANIPYPTSYQIDINMDVCNLVFVGKNWKKKGGDKILDTYRQLKSEGFPCTLTIIGTVPDTQYEEDESLIVIPFLDKSKPEDLNQYCKILYNSHFLVLPTEFDAYGIVFCEASAYAVPSFAADVGGVSQPVHEGKNGYLLSSNATAKDYAEKIKAVFNDKENYLKLRASSQYEFATRLNWDIWNQRINGILEGVVNEWNLTKEKKHNT